MDLTGVSRRTEHARRNPDNAATACSMHCCCVYQRRSTRNESVLGRGRAIEHARCIRDAFADVFPHRCRRGFLIAPVEHGPFQIQRHILRLVVVPRVLSDCGGQCRLKLSHTAVLTCEIAL